MSHRNAVIRYELHPQLAADSHPVAPFELCELRLMDDANYPWLVLVPRLPDARELLDLDQTQRHLLTDEIDRAARTLRDAFHPHKLNVAALGNLVPQLHVHVIARYAHDAAWPRPVWNVGTAQAYSADALQARLARLRAALQIEPDA